MGIHYPRRRLASITLLLAIAIPATAAAETLSILSQNMQRLFDDVDDGNREERLTSRKFEARIIQAATHLAGDFEPPRIIALQEVENLNVLQQIADRLQLQHGIGYRAILIDGQDISSINLGFLVQESVQVKKVEQLFRGQRLQAAAEPLFSRPPLLLHACYQQRCLLLVNLHLRSMRGIDSASQGERVARKRQQQATTVAIWSHQLQQLEPATDFILLGDFNALTPSDTKVDVAGVLLGNPDNTRTQLKSPDLINPDLVDLTRRIPQQQRYSYIYRQRRQQLDYMYANAALAEQVNHITYTGIDYRFSDHAGLLVQINW